MGYAKKEARLLLLKECSNGVFIALVFRGPYRVETVFVGRHSSILKDIVSSDIVKEVRLVWPSSLTEIIKGTRYIGLDDYFDACVDCVKNFFKSICDIANNLIVSRESL